MIEAVDILRTEVTILDAQQRDDGYVEAVYDKGDNEEQLQLFDKNAKRVEWNGREPEMYKLHKKLQIWFHSFKTLSKFKPAKNNEEVG